MVQHLQDILGKLYRPPADGTRQVFALSRSDAERLPLLPSIAVISITAPERPPANIGDFGYVLRLSFADVDFLNPDLSEKARGKLVHAFAVEHGNDIRSFIDALPDEVASVVVHCEGGTHVHALSPWRCIGSTATRRSFSTFRTLILQSSA